MPVTKRTSRTNASNNRGDSSIYPDASKSKTFKEVEEDGSLRSNFFQAFKPWRVFINHVDGYHGKKLAEFLSERVYVNPLSGAGEDLQDEEDERIEGIESEIEGEDEKVHKKEILKIAETSRKYQVIGSAADPEYPCPEDVTIINNVEHRSAFLLELMQCGIIIYDITEDKSQVAEARWALKAIVKELEKLEEKAPKAFKRNEDVRYFVLLSSIMSWASTKPLSPEEPDIPFTEADYRKRKPHPNFKEHSQCEKEVVIVKKQRNLSDKLKTLVICCGVTYGEEEGPLHYLFKMAWKNAEFLPVFGKGKNKIPLLHVRDLVTVVFTSLQNWPELRYIVAVEQELPSQNAIVKAISKELGSGKIKNIPKEEAFLLPEVTQQTYDLMTVNLNIDPVFITDRISWHFDMPFRDSINLIVKEFKAARNFYPMRVIILGPPASGKTMIARHLAKHYDIHYIHVKNLIEDTIKKLTNEIEVATSKPEEANDKDEDNDETDEEKEDLEDDEVVNVEELKEQLEQMEEILHKTDGRLDDNALNKLFLGMLRSKECLNQGYIIDGYPKTLEQAKALFDEADLNEGEDDDIDEETEAATSSVNSTIIPELVVALEASDEFLIERVINRPEREIQGTHYAEKHMIRRLKEYRERNTDENTPLQFFDEIEVHPLIIPIEDDVCPDMFPTIYQCLERLGKARNYGLTAEEAREMQKREREEAHAAEVAEKLQKEREFLEVKKQREEKMMEWTNLMEALKEEEEEKLCIMGLPLRNYLTRYVLPTLTQGLIEVANLRPDDPLDFLAEYLFKENPEGKMFKPDYTERMSTLLDAIEKLQDDVLPTEELSEEVIAFLKRESKVSVRDEKIECSVIDVCTDRKTPSVATPSLTYEEMEEMEKEGETISDKTDNNVEDF